ncbi:hypothetical protein [Atopobium fossor]|uniref:hypothetical protein n=1 Tax=Atopobium fossor TaxID=39487 RepID=UPI000418A850|nr:hypothetical protein [Atopobium fossor]
MAVVTSLLVSISLLFGMVGAGWYLAKSNKTQAIADSAALAGQNVIAGYTTIAQVLDSCVLSMGITGVLVGGAGLVLSAVPGLSAVGAQTVQTAKTILDARSKFAQSANAGLQKLEATLPFLIVKNSADVIQANNGNSFEYSGAAVPFPQVSQSQFMLDESSLDTQKLDDLAAKMGEQSDQVEQAKKEADAALMEGWQADCVDNPYCLYQRAKTLSSISSSNNPWYSSVNDWNFGVPLFRARAYYLARSRAEKPQGSSVEEASKSAARSAFYEYALQTLNKGHYRQFENGTIELDLPSLPANTQELKQTELYTKKMWPVTSVNGIPTMHYSFNCPGASGPSMGLASLADLDAGAVYECELCHFKTSDVGKTPAASTSINNGFEHYWAIIVQASKRYQKAKNQQIEAEEQMKQTAQEGGNAFEEALDALKVNRPKLCPPGAWGCIAFVTRNSSVPQTPVLHSSLINVPELPAGVAISAAVLAPDKADTQNNVLSHLFDGFSLKHEGLLAGLSKQICTIWGSLLMSYSDAYGSVAQITDSFFEKLEGIAGGTIAYMLQNQLVSLVEDAGLKPVNLQARKPVLTNTQKVLTKAGFGGLEELRAKIQSLPTNATTQQVAQAMGVVLINELPDEYFTIADLPIPGTELSIPLNVDVRKLVGLT